jgi:hypothetical protein
MNLVCHNGQAFEMVAVNSVPDLTSAFPNNKKLAAFKSWMLVDAKGNQCCWKWPSMTSCIESVSMLLNFIFWILLIISIDNSRAGVSHYAES